MSAWACCAVLVLVGLAWGAACTALGYHPHPVVSLILGWTVGAVLLELKGRGAS